MINLQEGGIVLEITSELDTRPQGQVTADASPRPRLMTIPIDTSSVRGFNAGSYMWPWYSMGQRNAVLLILAARWCRDAGQSETLVSCEIEEQPDGSNRRMLQMIVTDRTIELGATT